MSRLPRPNIPTAVELAVALRQIGDAPDTIKAKVAVAKKARRLGAERDGSLFVLACTLACPVDVLQLDHDPALENREKVFKNGIHVDYKPAANDPDWLFYRPHGPEFAGSHKIKTLVRGDHGQYSDAGLARKNKRIAKNRDPKRRTAKIAQRKDPWQKGRKFAKRPARR